MPLATIEDQTATMPDRSASGFGSFMTGLGIFGVMVAMLVFGLQTFFFYLAAPPGGATTELGPPLAVLPPVAAGKAARGELPAIKIRLQADARGELTGITMNQRTLSSADALRAEIQAILRSDGGVGSLPEIELDCDYNLKYQYTLGMVTALSGAPDGDARAKAKLVERIKLSPRRKP
jgi:biopolymer transport protein ExbD